MSRVAVLGLGNFGISLARELSRLGAEVVAVDADLFYVEKVKDEVHSSIRMDTRDRQALEDLGIHEVDVAVVCMGEDFEAAELTAVHLSDLGCPRVLVRGTTRERGEILGALGPEVITPGLLAGRALALRLMAPALVDYSPLVGAHGVGIVEVPDAADGLTLAELLRERREARVLAVRRGAAADSEVFVGPGDAQKLRTGDHVFLLGTEKELIRTSRRL